MSSNRFGSIPEVQPSPAGIGQTCSLPPADELLWLVSCIPDIQMATYGVYSMASARETAKSRVTQTCSVRLGRCCLGAPHDRLTVAQSRPKVLF